MAITQLIAALVISGLHRLCHGHVALTFPPARKYDLDFLDNVRTPSPCGGMKPGNKTIIPNGRDLAIAWHLGYPHNGGVRVTLHAENGSMIADLMDTETANFTDGSDKEMQTFVTFIPSSLTCNNCYVRLLRQATEWGQNYLFQSCADVEIQPLNTFSEDCSNHGSLVSGSCNCDRTYRGDRCQFKDDCDDDSDCNNNGKCLEVPEATTWPKKQCFCQQGYFGFNCQTESSFKNEEKTFNPAGYQLVKTKGAIDFYWRHVDDGKTEFEGVIVGNKVTSFVAVGWRPLDITVSCHGYPENAGVYEGKLFEMDCMDIVIGSVRDEGFSRIEDYYTRDRSTPRPDPFYGGTGDLTGALGWENENGTVIMFRRKVVGQGRTDHDFKGQLFFVWAHGQSNVNFYKEDELKYHGGNRGHEDIVVGNVLNTDAKILIAAGVILAILILIQFIMNVTKYCRT